jgi:hypothetical protein
MDELEIRAVPANLTSVTDTSGNQLQAAQTSAALTLSSDAAFEANYKVFSQKVSAYQLANLTSAFLHAESNSLTKEVTIPQLSQFNITLLNQQNTYIKQEFGALDPWYKSVTGQRLPAEMVLSQLLLFSQSFQTQEQTAVPVLVQEIQTGLLTSSQTAFMYTAPNLSNASPGPVSPVAPSRVISAMNQDQLQKFIASIANIQASSNITLTASANPIMAGNPVTFTAQMSPLGGATGSFTGTVTFSVDGVFQLTTSLNAMNQGAFTTKTLTKGMHQIEAAYSGDAKFPDVSTVLTEQVN